MSAMQAISEGRKLADDCGSKIVNAGGSLDDVATFLVFAATGDLSKGAGVVSFRSADPNADSSDLLAMQKHMRNTPVGFVVAVLDRESGEAIESVRPLLLEPTALTLLNSVADRIEEFLM